jgi:hypothetical protein
MTMQKDLMMSQLIAVVVEVTNFVNVVEEQNRQQYPLMLLFADLNALRLRHNLTVFQIWDL